MTWENYFSNKTKRIAGASLEAATILAAFLLSNAKARNFVTHT
jgi:hypothetical protein